MSELQDGSSQELEDDLSDEKVLEVYYSDEIKNRRHNRRLHDAIKAQLPGPGNTWVYICQIVGDQYMPNLEYSTEGDPDKSFEGSLLKIGWTTRNAGPIERLIELIQPKGPNGHTRLIALMVNVIANDERKTLDWMKKVCAPEDKAIVKGKKTNSEYFVYNATNVRRACYAMWTTLVGAKDAARAGEREQNLPRIYYCSNPTRMNSPFWFDKRSRRKKMKVGDRSQLPIEHFQMQFSMGDTVSDHPEAKDTLAKKREWLMFNLRAGRYFYAKYEKKQKPAEKKKGIEATGDEFQGIITGIYNFTDKDFLLTAIWDAKKDNPENNLKYYTFEYKFFGDAYFLKEAKATEVKTINLKFNNRDDSGNLIPPAAAVPPSDAGPSSSSSSSRPAAAGPSSDAGPSSSRATARPPRPRPSAAAGPSSDVAVSRKRQRSASDDEQRVLGQCDQCGDLVKVSDANAHLLVTNEGPVFLKNDLDPERAKGLVWAHKRCLREYKRPVKLGEPGYAPGCSRYTHCFYCDELVYSFNARNKIVFKEPRGTNKTITGVILHRRCTNLLNAQGGSNDGASEWVREQFEPKPKKQRQDMTISSLHRLFHSHVNI